MSIADLQTELDRFKEDFANARREVAKVIVGQDRVVEAVITAIIGGGNVLLEGVPGLGKTELVKTLARVLDLTRVQEVVAVEEIQRRLSHVGVWPRRAAAPRRR